jgi:radical SAM superfamily enzyme YgiQ (UPF0313 family)
VRVLFITKPYIIEPLGIASLSAVLKQHGHVVDLAETQSGLDEKLKKDILYFRPDIISYSVYTGSHRFFIDLNKQIRQWLNSLNYKRVLSVFGGPHCTYFHEISEEPYVDIVFRGESDEIITKTISSLELGEEVPEVIIPESNPLDLDSLPFPDRSIIYKNPKNARNPIKNIMTSRGCPFNCAYCYNSVYNKLFKNKPVRYRSIKKVIEEARQLIDQYPETKYIFFEDDEFAAKADRVKEFSYLWKREINIPFHVQLRIDLLTEDRIAMLKEAGCNSVTFAIESGNEEWRVKILNRRISNKVILDGAKMLRDHGILFRTENMVAQPGEEIHHALETLDLNIACRPTIGWASLFQPYPRTALGEKAKELGLFNGDIDDLPQSFFDRTVLNMPEEKSRRFENLQRLFGIACSYPAIRPAVPFLISLPRNRLYDWVYKWFKQKKYNILYNVKDFPKKR